MQEITTLDEAAQLCGASRRSVTRWINRGLFPEPIREIGKSCKTRAWRRKDIRNFAKKLVNGRYPKVPLV